MNRSVQELSGIESTIELESILKCPPDKVSGKVKCRVIYDHEIRAITFEHYLPRIIRTLKIVHDNTIEYSYKLLDRSCFERLSKGIAQDDILIVKNGWITDISFANIILWDGLNWHTPANPLLAGTKRKLLIDSGFLQLAEIRPSDLELFKEVRIINAMLNPLDHPSIAVTGIIR